MNYIQVITKIPGVPVLSPVQADKWEVVWEYRLTGFSAIYDWYSAAYIYHQLEGVVHCHLGRRENLGDYYADWMAWRNCRFPRVERGTGGNWILSGAGSVVGSGKTRVRLRDDGGEGRSTRRGGRIQVPVHGSGMTDVGS